ncbi:MAG: sodium-dependent dicarboxylate transporter 2/3/5 [Flavobacteriaceae bacterium]|jgi:sodium-dependent dicarboxylate transporter 2/3/5|tara:strand:- start:8021 stop:9484 length:1464 start_codon:yes stop_codon:yes gene_type:complete
MQKKIGLFLGPLAFTFIFLIGPFEGLSKEGHSILAATLWIAIWWITEAIPIAATALLPIILFPLTGGMELSTTTAAFGHKFVFLFFGGFLIAIGIEKWNLHKRIALTIIAFIGSDVRKIILGFMVATAFLSMWISNTATSVMMLPIGIGIIKQLKDNPGTEENENIIFGKALMLGIAYSASIGGIATLIGTPPNLVLAGVISETYGYEINFLEWFMFGFPISLILLMFCWVYLTRVAFTFKKNEFAGGLDEIKRLKNELGPLSYEERWVGIVFVLAAFSWISRSFILQPFFPALDDTIIAITFGLLLFILPSGKKKELLISWKDTLKLPWGILLLFGGGMALAKAFDVSGLAVWLGELMTAFGGLPLILLILLLVTAVNFLTEITSNLATTAMLLPVLAPLALEVGVHPFGLMIAAAIAASCAYMLPVATPPNAVVFSSGYLSIPDMVSRGIVLNVFSILLITVMVYFILPMIWGINLSSFPDALLP